MPMGSKFSVLHLALLIAAFFTAHSGFAQFEEFLLLEKPGKGNRIRYYVGDEILFKQYGDETFHIGLIVQLSDSSFYVNQFTEVPIRTVEALVDRSKVRAVRAFSKASFLVIPAVLLISAADNIFNTGSSPVIGEDALYVAGGFSLLGASGYLYRGKRYRLKNRWRIIAVRH